jgi:hypothetical protein
MSSKQAISVAIIFGVIGAIFLYVVIRDLMRYAKEYDRLFDEGKDKSK